ncbi:MAG: DUF5606 domain-containing protein [Paludibacteraceae bacterium]|nr:DUF5606 domain-containing protein [Paludibacteraceae bacterium]
MPKDILSISGRPGLFKVVSHSKNMLIVESLLDGKRIPAYTRDRIVALSDISMFTYSDDIPLYDVMQKMFEFENGAVASVAAKASEKELRDYFEKVLPDYDKERVHATDIKKLIQWYNLHVEKGLTDFVEAEEKPAEE